jgi:peptidoglycan-N-acetylglucosamine deacetylase
LKRSFKKNKFKRVSLILLGFIFIFSMGFIAGNKFLNKPASDPSNKSLQANPDTNNKDNTNNSNNTPATNANSTNKNEGTSTTNNGTSTDEKVEPNKNDSNETKTSNTSENKKEVFLTFDDGPTTNITPRILETLDKYNVKASFFVIGKNAEKHPELIKEEKAKGHFIANHTYSHEYDYIYSNTDNFLKDLEKCRQVLNSILGEYDSKIIRFPGGSFGSKRASYREAVKNAGYSYVDWNALNGDAERLNVPADELINRIKETVGKKNHVVILMHDAATKKTTADSLGQVIEYLKSQGYEFKTLDQDTKL